MDKDKTLLSEVNAEGAFYVNWERKQESYYQVISEQVADLNWGCASYYVPVKGFSLSGNPMEYQFPIAHIYASLASRDNSFADIIADGCVCQPGELKLFSPSTFDEIVSFINRIPRVSVLLAASEMEDGWNFVEYVRKHCNPSVFFLRYDDYLAHFPLIGSDTVLILTVSASKREVEQYGERVLRRCGGKNYEYGGEYEPTVVCVSLFRDLIIE